MGLRPVPLTFALIALASGVGFLISTLLTPWLLAWFGWCIPLPFVAAALIIVINRSIDDRKFTTGYFALWAIIGLTLMPLAIVVMVWVSALQHDQLVGDICGPELPKETCTPTAELVSQTNSAFLPSLSFILGWFVPSLVFVILGYSCRVI